MNTAYRFANGYVFVLNLRCKKILSHSRHYAYTIRLLFLLYITTVTVEARTIMAFAAIVPVQVIVMVPKTGDAALNMVWNNTHINTRPLPDIL